MVSDRPAIAPRCIVNEHPYEKIKYTPLSDSTTLLLVESHSREAVEETTADYDLLLFAIEAASDSTAFTNCRFLKDH